MGVRCSFFVEKMEFRTYFVHFHTFSYKFKVQRTHTELGLPVQTHALTGALFSLKAKTPRIVDVFGLWEPTLIQRWREEGMVVFSRFSSTLQG